MSNPSTQTVRDWLIGLQQRITAAIAATDGSGFLTDAWEKPPGEALQGNGITMILEDGPLFERAGCGFSHVSGPKLPPSATMRASVSRVPARPERAPSTSLSLPSRNRVAFSASRA